MDGDGKFRHRRTRSSVRGDENFSKPIFKIRVKISGTRERIRPDIFGNPSKKDKYFQSDENRDGKVKE